MRVRTAPLPKPGSTRLLRSSPATASTATSSGCPPSPTPRIPDRVDAIEQEAEVARRLGLPAVFTTETDLPYPVEAAVRVDDQAAFHPRKFCAGLARLLVERGGHVFEHSRATGLEPGPPAIVTTEGGEVSAAHVV